MGGTSAVPYNKYHEGEMFIGNFSAHFNYVTDAFLITDVPLTKT